MKIKRLTLLFILAALAASAFAAPSAQAVKLPKVVTIHILNKNGYSDRYLSKVERAIRFQVNHQLHPIWHTPLIRFTRPTGFFPKNINPRTWIAMLSGARVVYYGMFDAADGYHLWWKPMTFINVAARAANVRSWPMGMPLILSHEIIEALVDPTGTRHFNHTLAEVCDAVERPGYMLDGVRVEDFVTPRWFGLNEGPRRYDFLGRLKAPETTSPQGGFMPGSGL